MGELFTLLHSLRVFKLGKRVISIASTLPRLRGARNSEIAHTSATSTDAVEGSTASIKIKMIRWQLARTAKTKKKIVGTC
jgi:hypothetical protein